MYLGAPSRLCSGIARQSVREVAVATETAEHRATRRALKQVYDYISPGTNEGISFALSCTGISPNLDTWSAGGDISLFSPGGQHGSIHSQSSTGTVLDGSGAAVAFPIEVRLNLNTGKVHGAWTLPGGSAQSPVFSVELCKDLVRPEGHNLIFSTDASNDDFAYTLSLLLI
jgi:hypothetical protein